MKKIGTFIVGCLVLGIFCGVLGGFFYIIRSFGVHNIIHMVTIALGAIIILLTSYSIGDNSIKLIKQMRKK